MNILVWKTKTWVKATHFSDRFLSEIGKKLEQFNSQS